MDEEIPKNTRRIPFPSNFENLPMSDVLSIEDARVRRKLSLNKNINIQMRETQFSPEIGENNLAVSRRRSTGIEFKSHSPPISLRNSNDKINLLTTLITNSIERNKSKNAHSVRYKEFDLNFQALESFVIQNSDLSFKDKCYQNFVIKDYTSSLKEKINYLQVILENGLIVF